MQISLLSTKVSTFYNTDFEETNYIVDDISVLKSIFCAVENHCSSMYLCNLVFSYLLLFYLCISFLELLFFIAARWFVAGYWLTVCLNAHFCRDLSLLENFIVVTIL